MVATVQLGANPLIIARTIRNLITRPTGDFVAGIGKILNTSVNLNTTLNSEPIRNLTQLIVEFDAESNDKAKAEAEITMLRRLNELGSLLRAEAPRRSGKLARSISAGRGNGDSRVSLRETFNIPQTTTVRFFVQARASYAPYVIGSQFENTVDNWFENILPEIAMLYFVEFKKAFDARVGGV